MDNNNWRLFNGTRAAKHKTGLVIHASPTIEEDEYLLKYYNQDHYKGNDDDKLLISKEFIMIMKDKYKDNAHYIIPNPNYKQIINQRREIIGKNI